MPLMRVIFGLLIVQEGWKFIRLDLDQAIVDVVHECPNEDHHQKDKGNHPPHSHIIRNIIHQAMLRTEHLCDLYVVETSAVLEVCRARRRLHTWYCIYVANLSSYGARL